MTDPDLIWFFNDPVKKTDKLYVNRFNDVPDEHDDRLDGQPVPGELEL